MYCKKCLEFVDGDCMLTTGVCVFCHYKINTWDSNGMLVKKKDSIKSPIYIFAKWRKELVAFHKYLITERNFSIMCNC